MMRLEDDLGFNVQVLWQWHPFNFSEAVRHRAECGERLAVVLDQVVELQRLVLAHLDLLSRDDYRLTLWQRISVLLLSSFLKSVHVSLS